MTSDLSPRGFLTFNEFAEAFVERRVANHEPVTPYDDYATAQAKVRHLERDRQYAREDALEAWESFLECAIEDFDRGVGASWD